MHLLILISFLFSGLSALVYEVVWTRALSLILGSTVYSLSIMLATFMAGLAAGSYIGGMIADRSSGKGSGTLLFYYGLSETGIGISGILSIPLIYTLPSLYFKLYLFLRDYTTLFFFSQFLLASMVMIIPTILMGFTFPIVSKILTERLENLGKWVGSAYSFNTVGAIFGSLLAGFVFIPSFGLKATALIAGLFNFIIGIVFIYLSKKIRTLLPLFFLFIFSLYPFLKASPSDYFATFYMLRRFESLEQLRSSEASYRVLYEKDHPQGFVRAYLDENGFVTLQHGGKMEGTAFTDVPNTLFLVELPVRALRDKPEDILVIGLGAGVTTWIAGRHAPYVDVVEINPAVVEIVRKFGIPETLKNKNLYINDARRYLLYNEKKYDIITSEPSVPSEAMAANLFTKEFYEIASKRLKPHGIMAQWVPGWIFTRDELRSCIKTFRMVFPYVYVYKVKASRDFIMLGSQLPLESVPQTGILLPSYLPPMLEEMKKIRGIEPLFDIELVRTAESVREILEMAHIPVITDDRPLIEFWATRNFLKFWVRQ
ncbi:MAG: fused MFS/spermidine synthase [Thermodesulfovibrionales bacterium]|nr:fused MFS/spermidine synthase [Thermodesulfovibrionales bacterium]